LFTFSSIRYDTVVKRPLFTTLATLSLVLGVTDVAVWVRSYYVSSDHLQSRLPGDRGILFASALGRGFIEYDQKHIPWPNRKSYAPRAPSFIPCDDCSTLLGFALIRDDYWIGPFFKGDPPTTHDPRWKSSYALAMPHWFIVLITALAPAWWLLIRSRPEPAGPKRPAGSSS
jgi:hypothetical protein